MNHEMPSLTSTVGYSTSSLSLDDLLGQQAVGAQAALGNVPFGGFLGGESPKAFITRRVASMAAHVNEATPVSPPTGASMAATRLVRIFIVDNDANLPIDKRTLYKGDELLTDASDQELYFEVPIVDLLKQHNVVRQSTQLPDKLQSADGKPRFLEAIRIRDLKMAVVTVAAFA